MRLVSVTVENFRSITAGRKIPISQLTTLVGPNNEGKSNILRALVLAMNYLVARRRTPAYLTRYRIASPQERRRLRALGQYDWSTDFPLKQQQKHPNKASVITLEFELLDQEVDEFYTAIASRLNGTLPISFSFKKSSEEIIIPKQGRGQKALNSKAAQIAEFIADKIEIQYIPAVRTAESAQAIVDELVQKELEKIENDEKYQQALADIKALQEPILDGLSRNITSTMRSFLPNISQAKILIQEHRRSFALRGISEILLDDGAETPLEYKGDGVQSLAALALMRHASQSDQKGKEVLIALEEPESHLHPSAIRQLRDVLMELSTNHQVVLTTHNPIFTNRRDIHQNIIVSGNRAYAARTVKEVRSVLGVRLDDNLSSAEVVLIVEGEEDRIALKNILSDLDANLSRSFTSGRLAIDVLGGASNLSHRVRLHSETLCKVQVFIDDDRAGRQAITVAQRDNVLGADSFNLTAVAGKDEAELEDLYDESVYGEIIRTEAGLPLVKRGPDSAKKWTDRVRNLLRSVGRPYDDAAIMSVKIKVAKAAAVAGSKALQTNKRAPIESLRNSLLQKLST